MLNLNPGLIIWTIITFIIVLAILRALAWKPLLAALHAREERIRSALAQAQEAQLKAQQLLDEHSRRLAEAEEHSQRIIREGRMMGEKLKAEILEKADQSSRQMVAQAKEEIGREKEAALSQLRNEVADLAILAAGKILDANLDTQKQRQLVDTVIRDINNKNG